MPKLVVLENAVGPERETELPEGGELVDAADEARLPIPFSCRSATCATCLIEIVEGAEHLEPPNDYERELLEILAGPPENRLACQARVRAGAGVLKVRPTY
ncbi:MAG TPA: 2Fe-2S iron-sulfur cluster-binding protein [Polyangiaceae bacterium]|nr:2Fe-2S iron-sulfur cluster-binding protein [Polyangiaceae bacterium]